MTHMSTAPPTGPPIPDASMSLLAHLMEGSLDAGYAEAAARRTPSTPGRRGIVLAVGLLVVGLLLATSAVQTHSRQSGTAAARAALIDKVTERSARADRLAGDVALLRASVADLRQARLEASAEGKRLTRELAVLEGWTGAAPVVGPAVVIHLEDAPDDAGGARAQTDPRAGGSVAEGKVTDRDLQTIVNEMWVADAEAVAVNGQRLTSLSAIRSAGPNILVAFRPLNPPYDIVAIGDNVAMRAKLLDGFASSYLDVLGNYGIKSSVTTRAREKLPPSAGLTLRHASVPNTERQP